MRTGARPARTVGHAAFLAAASVTSVCWSGPLTPPAGATPAPPVRAVLVATTTTVPGSTTTTTSTQPPSTTTMTTPTTSTVPTTTTTTTPTTSTTHPSTTTTTTVPASTTSSTTPWPLIALVAVLVLAIIGVILLYVSRTKRSAADAWRRRALPALSDARLAREALLTPSAVADDAELRGAVAVQVERAATALDHTGSTAPDPAAGGPATTAAGALRGLAFAIEADRLLRNGTAPPTGVQLAQADAARRDRDAELQGAHTRLQSRVTPASGRH